VVSRATGIPVSKMMTGEREKLLHMEDKLHERVVGQDEAVRLVSDAIRRSPFRPVPIQIVLRILPVPRSHRCGQEPSCARRWRIYVRFRRGSPIRIDMSEYNGEAFRGASDRCSARLCGL